MWIIKLDIFLAPSLQLKCSQCGHTSLYPICCSCVTVIVKHSFCPDWSEIIRKQLFMYNLVMKRNVTAVFLDVLFVGVSALSEKWPFAPWVNVWGLIVLLRSRRPLAVFVSCLNTLHLIVQSFSLLLYALLISPVHAHSFIPSFPFSTLPISFPQLWSLSPP